MSEKPTPAGEEASNLAPEQPGKEGATSTPSGDGAQLKINSTKKSSRAERVMMLGAWLVAFSLVLLAVYYGWRTKTPYASALGGELTALNTPSESIRPTLASVSLPAPSVELPAFVVDDTVRAISRRTLSHTIIPTRPRQDVITHTVTTGDSVFGIAKNYNIQPESVLWANYDLLKDSPDMLSPGMNLRIPPVDGVFYEWKEGDTIEAVAGEFEATAEDILNWSGNNLDLTNPVIEPGQMVLIPGGEREFVQWVIPTIPRGAAGVSKSLYGPGACEGSYDGAYGTGTFIWPSGNHVLSGNDYWSGHLAIDIAAAVGDGIFASDSGVIVFAGWATGGYGYMVMVDHGNGYQTLYSHMSAVSASCGQSVSQGQYIGAAGSTGNSTGPHIHFEIRYLGGFVNPWYMLP